jgi:hypothetical protein
VWGYETRSAAVAARLPNEHTLITESDRNVLLEVDRRGKVVRQRKTMGRPWHVQVLP